MAERIDIGQMYERVTLQRCVVTAGAEGEKIETFEDVEEISAAVSVIAQESVDDGNVAQEEQIDVTIYRRPMDSSWRLKWCGKSYNIRTITPVGRMSPFIRLTAEQNLE
ncbi:MAG: phage head closure protein [Bacteroidales bacterium]|nr:phage head closure protein [Bacteroidales bacterium]